MRRCSQAVSLNGVAGLEMTDVEVYGSRTDVPINGRFSGAINLARLAALQIGGLPRRQHLVARSIGPFPPRLLPTTLVSTWARAVRVFSRGAIFG